ncbi:hypothetical protein VCHENC02_3542A, partial [Vibrio harveyi]
MPLSLVNAPKYWLDDI